MKHAFEEMNVCGTTVSVRHKEHIDEIDALIIPGGDISTIS